MYIDSITVREFRTFKRASIDFVHPDQQSTQEQDRPSVANMNLMIGANGSGKTTLLKSIALAALGPAVADSGLYPYHLIRREAGNEANAVAVKAVQDHPVGSTSRYVAICKHLATTSTGTRSSDAFFFVGYGANRRVEKVERVDEGGATSVIFHACDGSWPIEGASVESLLPRYQAREPERFSEVGKLINRLVGIRRYRFIGVMEDGEYLFQHRNNRVPFPALSDGYRALLGWIGDLLYHICETCPSNRRLDEYQGIVMIDEVDRTFIGSAVTSATRSMATANSGHLPQSLEWLPQRTDGSSVLERAISKMDADQILLTELFGLESTRSGSQTRRIRELLESIREGDTEAAQKLMAELSGSEP